MNPPSDRPGPLPSAFQRSLSLLEHKRRLVSSSPKVLSLDLAAFPASFSSSPAALPSSSSATFPASAPLVRRTRSRHSSRTLPPLQPLDQDIPYFPVSPTTSLLPFPLLTPTTEEWLSLGLESAPQAGDIDQDQPPSPMESADLLLECLSSISLESQQTDFYVFPQDLPEHYSNARSLYNSAVTPEPSLYSGFSREYNISDFIIYQDAGKGAYGLVKRARLKGPNGEAIGPHLIIKYIYKQRILADCWQYHRTLGTIPVEVHVLEYLSRVYTPISRNHPNICGMYDFFEDPDHYYLVMPKFGNGKDLFDHVEANPYGLPIDEIISICRQVSAAIAFLHQNRIVHRDIKDENVILDGAGGVQLIDFGSATYYREGQLFDTFSGTLDFMAPEVVRRERYGGKEIDIWALGILFYVVLCGEMPFHAQEALSGLVEGGIPYNQMMSRVTQAQTRSQEEALIVSDFVDLTMRCLELDPVARPSAAAVLQHRVFSYSDTQETPSTSHGYTSSNISTDTLSTAFIEKDWVGPRGWHKAEETTPTSSGSQQTTPTQAQHKKEEAKEAQTDAKTKTSTTMTMDVNRVGGDRSSSISLVSSLSSLSSLSTSRSSTSSTASPPSPNSPTCLSTSNNNSINKLHLAHHHLQRDATADKAYSCPKDTQTQTSPLSSKSPHQSPTSTAARTNSVAARAVIKA